MGTASTPAAETVTAGVEAAKPYRTPATPRERVVYAGSGVNMRAIAATVIGCALAWVGLVVKPLAVLYDYAWFVGAGGAALAYVLLMPSNAKTKPASTTDRFAHSSARHGAELRFGELLPVRALVSASRRGAALRRDPAPASTDACAREPEGVGAGRAGAGVVTVAVPVVARPSEPSGSGMGPELGLRGRLGRASGERSRDEWIAGRATGAGAGAAIEASEAAGCAGTGAAAEAGAAEAGTTTLIDTPSSSPK